MIVFETKFDVPKRQAVVLMADWAKEEHDVHLEFTDALDLVGAVRMPLGYEDFAEYVVDAINEGADVGTWYTLTADFNINLDRAEEG